MPNADIDPRGQGGFLRIKQIVKLIPIGRSTWWLGVRRGKYPKPVKLGPRTTVWYREDIEKLIANAGEAEMATSWVIRRKTRSLAGAPAEPADQGA
jgi:prophage regulatory protein